MQFEYKQTQLLNGSKIIFDRFIKGKNKQFSNNTHKFTKYKKKQKIKYTF